MDDKILSELERQTKLLESINEGMPYSYEERLEIIEQTLSKVLEQLRSLTSHVTDIKSNTSK